MEHGIFLTSEELSNMMENVAAKAVHEYITATSSTKDEKKEPGPKVIRGYKGLCEFLGISSTTLWRLKKSKKIPYIQRGKVLFFQSDAVLKALGK